MDWIIKADDGRYYFHSGCSPCDQQYITVRVGQTSTFLKQHKIVKYFELKSSFDLSEVTGCVVAMSSYLWSDGDSVFGKSSNRLTQITNKHYLVLVTNCYSETPFEIIIKKEDLPSISEDFNFKSCTIIREVE